MGLKVQTFIFNKYYKKFLKHRLLNIYYNKSFIKYNGFTTIRNKSFHYIFFVILFL